MNKTFASLCVIFFFNGLYARLDLERPEAQPNIPLSLYERFSRGYNDFMGLERLGFQALKKENELYLRAIISDLGMEDHCIEIRGMSNFAQQLFGRSNAFVIAPIFFSNKSHTYFFMSEDWFETLSDGEKQALIRHELMHIKHNHAKKHFWGSILSGAALLGLYKIFLKEVGQKCSYDPRIVGVLQASIGVCVFYGWILFVAKLSRSLEKEADINAALTMKDKNGFIDLFTELKENTEDPMSKFAFKRFFERLGKFVGKFFHTHPSIDERIEYMINL